MCRKVETEQDRRNRNLSKALKEEAKTLPSKIKLLLLGTGESGKSTFFKQMKILHLNGFTVSERESYKYNVYVNLLQNVVSLLEATERMNVPIEAEHKEAAERVFSMDASQDFSNEAAVEQLLADSKLLWADKSIQECYSRNGEFQLNDSAKYFFDNLDRISQRSYIPTVDDILRIRAKTSGVTEQTFQIGKDHFSIIDVGGQRSERRKWIHCFNDVTALIFFSALSEYDQKLSEDESTNRMSESLKLFFDISHYKYFAEQNIPIILFLNKADLFKEKIINVPLTVCFKDYKGSNEFKEASEFIQQKFVSQAPNGKQIFAHITIATDTENIKFVFKAVKEIIITAHLRSMGMMVQ